MELSAGFIIIDKSTHKVLGGHPTGRPYTYNYAYDIPKGHIENGETPLEAAKRELKEETGIVLQDGQEIHEIGHVAYNSKKSLHLFSTEMDVDLKSLHCDSTFIDSFGNVKKEIDHFILTDRCDQFFQNMRRHVMRELQRRYKVRRVEIFYDGVTYDNYLPTSRFNRIQNKLIDAYDRNTYCPTGEIDADLHQLSSSDSTINEDIPLLNSDIEKALNNSHVFTNDVWLFMKDQKFPFEFFDFDEWMSVELS
jgi:8-oxo-dGTP pyrophosphatase MutT (NUDIX family)